MLTMTPDELLPGICTGWQERAAEILSARPAWSALELIEAGRAAGAEPGDILHVIFREDLMDARTLRLLACDFAEHALCREREAGREPDARSWKAVEVARRYARGEATEEELGEAWTAAWAARDAARAATWATYWATAEAAAWAAQAAATMSRAAAQAAAACTAEAEREWQLEHVEAVLRGHDTKGDANDADT